MTAFTPLPTEPPTLVTLLDEADASTLYIGKAVPGTAESAANWSIQKMAKVGNVTKILRADSGYFTQVWNNRASLSYA